MGPKQALVFGASGISGWAIARECLVYPSQDTFARVIGLTNRPLEKDHFLLTTDLDRFEVHNGIDLSQNADVVAQGLKNIAGIERTTTVFYTAYGGHYEAYGSPNPFEHLCKFNHALLRCAVAAVEAVCPNLEVWVLQTGAKAYGFELLGQPGLPYSPPLKENDLPLPEPFRGSIFYNGQLETLELASRNSGWKFCEIMPDLISGFAPRTNPLCFGQLMGLFLGLYADLEGKGVEVVFPGPTAAYVALHSDTSQDILARFSIFASLHLETASQRYNISDQDAPVSFETLWPDLCALYGLKGVGPQDVDDGKPKGADWVLANKDHWKAFEERHQLRTGIYESSPWPMLAATTNLVVFDRHLMLGKARALGFRESRAPIEGYRVAFERLRSQKLIA